MRPAIFKYSAFLLTLNKNAEISFSQFKWLRTNGIWAVLSQHNYHSVTHKLLTHRSPQFCERNLCVRNEMYRNYNSESSVCLCASGVKLQVHSTNCENRLGIHTFSGVRFISRCVKLEMDEKGLESNNSSSDVFQMPYQRGLPESQDLADSQTDLDLTQSHEVEVRIGDRSLPELSRTVYNLAPYVVKSETLQKLVKLGVNLSKVEKVKGIASLLMMSDFDKDILPYVQHLIRVGVPSDKLGYVLSVNPMVLTEYIQHLEQRVGYLLSKDFSMPEIASMYTRAPVMILMDPVKLDAKLGFLQQAFGLSASEVREVALTFPKILPWRKQKIANIRFDLKEFLGFEDDELKLMLLKEPKLFTADIHKVKKTFDYVHNTMLIPHSLIVKWPAVLRCRLHIAKARHLFLLHLGRAQYDPHKENYVSMKSLVACKDGEFCDGVARSTEAEFHSFLKTL